MARGELHKFAVGKGIGMPGGIPPLFRSGQGHVIIRRIGKDMVEFAALRHRDELFQRGVDRTQHPGSWRGREVARGFCSGRTVNINGIDHHFRGFGSRGVRNGNATGPAIAMRVMRVMKVMKERKPLRRHKGDSSGPCPDIKTFPVGHSYSHQRTEKDAIGVDLHGGLRVLHGEMSEAEYAHSQISGWLSVRRSAFVCKQTVPHIQAAVTHACQFRVMRHDDKCLAEFIAQPEKKAVKLLLGHTVQIP